MKGDYTLNQLKDFITKHDLTYAYSDDNRAYRRGSITYKLITDSIAKFDLRTSHGKEAKAILIDHWNNKVEQELIEAAWHQFKWEE
jgi:hypothetical protein